MGGLTLRNKINIKTDSIPSLKSGSSYFTAAAYHKIFYTKLNAMVQIVPVPSRALTHELRLSSSKGRDYYEVNLFFFPPIILFKAARRKVMVQRRGSQRCVRACLRDQKRSGENELSKSPAAKTLAMLQNDECLNFMFCSAL